MRSARAFPFLSRFSIHSLSSKSIKRGFKQERYILCDMKLNSFPCRSSSDVKRRKREDRKRFLPFLEVGYLGPTLASRLFLWIPGLRIKSDCSGRFMLKYTLKHYLIQPTYSTYFQKFFGIFNSNFNNILCKRDKRQEKLRNRQRIQKVLHHCLNV